VDRGVIDHPAAFGELDHDAQVDGSLGESLGEIVEEIG
jgi:hypothetical protein